MEILDCVFCMVALDERCPCCAGYGIGAIDREKGLRPLTDAEFLAACEESVVEIEVDAVMAEAA